MLNINSFAEFNHILHTMPIKFTANLATFGASVTLGIDWSIVVGLATLPPEWHVTQANMGFTCKQSTSLLLSMYGEATGVSLEVVFLDLLSLIENLLNVVLTLFSIILVSCTA